MRHQNARTAPRIAGAPPCALVGHFWACPKRRLAAVLCPGIASAHQSMCKVRTCDRRLGRWYTLHTHMGLDPKHYCRALCAARGAHMDARTGVEWDGRKHSQYCRAEACSGYAGMLGNGECPWAVKTSYMCLFSRGDLQCCLHFRSPLLIGSFVQDMVELSWKLKLGHVGT